MRVLELFGSNVLVKLYERKSSIISPCGDSGVVLTYGEVVLCGELVKNEKLVVGIRVNIMNRPLSKILIGGLAHVIVHESEVLCSVEYSDSDFIGG